MDFHFGVALVFSLSLLVIVAVLAGRSLLIKRRRRGQSPQIVRVIQDKVRYIDLDCPVEVKEVRIKLDEANNSACCGIDLVNLSEKAIASVDILLSCSSPPGGPAEKPGVKQIKTSVQGETGPREALATAVIPLTGTPRTKTIDVIITRVEFSDQTSWEGKGGRLHPVNIDSITGLKELTYLKDLAGEDAVSYGEEKGDTWTCVCGRLNLLHQEKCRRCGREKGAVLLNFNCQEVRARQERENLEEMKGRREEEKRKEDLAVEKAINRRINRKVLGYSSLTATVLLVISLVVVGAAATGGTFSYQAYELSQLDSTDEDGNTFLLRALKEGNTEEALRLVKKGVNLEARNNQGETPLLLAVKGEHLPLVESLLENGARADTRTQDDQAPLHLAVAQGNYGIASLLANTTAGLDQRNSLGETPLLLAVKEGQQDIARLLIRAGADLDRGDPEGKAPLHWAVVKQDRGLATLLIEGGAGIDLGNYYGETPLIMAVKGGQAEMANLLLRFRADINQGDQEGQTPLHWAVRLGDIDMVKLLLDFQAGPMVKNAYQETPWDIAQGEVLAAFTERGIKAGDGLVSGDRLDPSVTPYKPLK